MGSLQGVSEEYGPGRVIVLPKVGGMLKEKITKIAVCDVCGDEVPMYADYKPECCGKCGKELCSNCTETFSIDVTKLSRSEKFSDGTTHWSQTTEYEGHTGRYCPGCAAEVVRGLDGLGLIKQKPSYLTVTG
jgi:hypothetical protein